MAWDVSSKIGFFGHFLRAWDSAIETLDHQIQNAGKVSAGQLVRPAAIGMAAFGLACAVGGLLAELALGSSLTPPGFVLRGGGWSSFASTIYIVFVSCVCGMFGAIALAVFAQRAADGRSPHPMVAGVWIELQPVWWARAIKRMLVLFVIILGIGAVIGLAELVGAGAGWSTKFQIGKIFDFIPKAFGLAFVVSLCFLIGDGFHWLDEYLQRSLSAYPRLWTLYSALICLALTVILYPFLLGGAVLVDPIFAAASLGSTRTPTAAFALLPLAIAGAYVLTKFSRADREPLRPTLSSDDPLTPVVNDTFRMWDLGVETSYQGELSNGLPFHVWRESADNRLGLSRSRYCCVTQEGGELYFTFFNPSKNVRSSGGLAVLLGVSGIWAISWFIGWMLTPRPKVPYIYDTSAPLLELFAIALSAAAIGPLVGGFWHVMVTLRRWSRDRFADDGRIVQKPLRMLQSFNQVHAADTDAFTGDVDLPKTGHGLTAFFHDGTIMYLTANAWDGPSIARKHQALNAMFIDGQAALFAKLAAADKKQVSVAGPQHVSLSNMSGKQTLTDGIPDEI